MNWDLFKDLHTYHRSYSQRDAHPVPGEKSSNPLTIKIKYVMIMWF